MAWPEQGDFNYVPRMTTHKPTRPLLSVLLLLFVLSVHGARHIDYLSSAPSTSIAGRSPVLVGQQQQQHGRDLASLTPDATASLDDADDGTERPTQVPSSAPSVNPLRHRPRRSRPRPLCNCTKDLRPVCGEDDTTYANGCLARCNNTSISYQGACKQSTLPLDENADCNCFQIHRPVCGSDNKTYTNACVAACSGITQHTKGQCSAASKPGRPPSAPKSVLPQACKCSNRYNPVCGPDGQTYSSPCRARCAGLGSFEAGECPPGPEAGSAATPGATCTRCGTIWAPVCAPDGKTWSNACRARCAGVTQYERGACPGGSEPTPSKPLPRLDQEPAPCACPENEEPVCGSDGVTYINDCLAGCAGVDDFTAGACTAGSLAACSCPRVWAPVCGDDGSTYSSDCEAECRNVMKYEPGECAAGGLETAPGRPRCPCITIWAPVCSEDSTTFPNDCMLACAGAKKARDGACTGSPGPLPKPRPVQEVVCGCLPDLQPVCGSDGVTHNSSCWARCAGASSFTEGPCPAALPGTAPAACTCDAVLDPVCGSDSHTYSSPCHARCVGVQAFKLGACSSNPAQPTGPSASPPCPCPKLLAPVCGADGVTYLNDCLARCANARVVHAGACDGSSTPAVQPNTSTGQAAAGSGASTAAAEKASGPQQELVKLPRIIRSRETIRVGNVAGQHLAA